MKISKLVLICVAMGLTAGINATTMNANNATIGMLLGERNTTVNNQHGAFELGGEHPIYAGDTIETQAGPAAVVQLNDGGHIYVSPQSSVTFKAPEEGASLALNRGAVGYKLNPNSKVQIQTPEYLLAALDSSDMPRSMAGVVAVGENKHIAVKTFQSEARVVDSIGKQTIVSDDSVWLSDQDAPIVVAAVDDGSTVDGTQRIAVERNLYCADSTNSGGACCQSWKAGASLSCCLVPKHGIYQQSAEIFSSGKASCSVPDSMQDRLGEVIGKTNKGVLVGAAVGALEAGSINPLDIMKGLGAVVGLVAVSAAGSDDDVSSPSAPSPAPAAATPAPAPVVSPPAPQAAVTSASPS